MCQTNLVSSLVATSSNEMFSWFWSHATGTWDDFSFLKEILKKIQHMSRVIVLNGTLSCSVPACQGENDKDRKTS